MKNAFAIVPLAILGFAFDLEETAEKGDLQKEWDGAIPWDAWVSWGVGGAIMLIVLFAIIWTAVPRCMKKERTPVHCANPRANINKRAT